MYENMKIYNYEIMEIYVYKIYFLHAQKNIDLKNAKEYVKEANIL